MSEFIKLPIHELVLNEQAPVTMGNPGDVDYEGVQLLKVERIHKTIGGWQFMGRKTKTNGDELLCLCTNGRDADAYYTTMAVAYGEVSGRTRNDAIRILGFSPE